MKILSIDNSYHRLELRAMTCKEDILIDHMWNMFNHLEDTDDESVIDTAVYMSNQYNFDIEVLPSKLYDAVVDKIRKDAEESYWEGEAQSVIDGTY